MVAKKQVAETAPAAGKQMAEGDWEKELAQYATAESKEERPSAASIGLRAGVMTYAGNPLPDNKLDCIILSSCVEHSWYEGSFDPNAIKSPSCFALSKEHEGLVPHPNSTAVQCDTCDNCPKFKWGSNPKGGRGKACQERRRLLVIPSQVETPDDVLTAEVGILKLPVTSVSNWGTYINTLAALHKRPSFGMITTISTKPDPKSQFKVIFTAKTGIEYSLLNAIIQKRDASDVILLKPYDPAGSTEEPATKEGTKY